MLCTLRLVHRLLQPLYPRLCLRSLLLGSLRLLLQALMLCRCGLHHALHRLCCPVPLDGCGQRPPHSGTNGAHY